MQFYSKWDRGTASRGQKNKSKFALASQPKSPTCPGICAQYLGVAYQDQGSGAATSENRRFRRSLRRSRGQPDESRMSTVLHERELNIDDAEEQNKRLREQNQKLNRRFRRFVREYEAMDQEITRLRGYNERMKQLLLLNEAGRPSSIYNIHQSEDCSGTEDESELRSYLPLDTSRQEALSHKKSASEAMPIGRLTSRY